MSNNEPDLFSNLPADPEDSLTLANYAERAYLDYAISVVKVAHYLSWLTVKNRSSVEFYIR